MKYVLTVVAVDDLVTDDQVAHVARELDRLARTHALRVTREVRDWTGRNTLVEPTVLTTTGEQTREILENGLPR